MFKTQNQKSLKNVKPVREHPSVIEAREKRAELDAQLAEVTRQQLAAEAGKSDDAQAILSGRPLETNTLADLQRRRRAIEAAIVAHGRIAGQIQRDVANTTCREVSPLVFARIEAVVEAFELLGLAIDQLQLFLDELSRRGLRPENQAGWCLWPIERQVKNQLETYSTNRRRTIENKKRKTA